MPLASQERTQADGTTLEAAAPGIADAALSLDFRNSMRRHASGVCIVTAGQGEAVNGMAVTAASSFSMDPPSVLVCLNQSASIFSQLGEGASFGLTLLHRGHEAVTAAFSRKPSGRARFDHGPWRLEPGQPPWLEDAPANLGCVVEGTFSYGTHTAVIGRVRQVRLGPDAPSLTYRDGRYL